MAKKKKSAFKNISENIGIKQRVFIGVMVLASAASLGVTYMGFSGGSKESSMATPEEVAQSRLSLGANNAKVEKAKVGEQNNFDPNSPMAEKVREAREKEIAEAKEKEGAGFMDPIILADKEEEQDAYDPLDALINDTKQNTLEELYKEKSKTDLVTGIDDTVDKQSQEERRKQRIAEMTQDVEAAKKLPGTQYVYVNRYGSELTDEFINGEMGRLSSIKDSVNSSTRGVALTTGKYNNGGVQSAIRGDGKANANSAGQSTTDDPYYSAYFRDRRADAQPDFETSNNISRMVNQQLGSLYDTSSGSGRIGGFDGSSSEQEYANEYEQERRSDTKPIKTVGDVCYAQLNMPVNTDAPTMVKATILDYNCGKLRGAQLIAEPQRTGNWVQLSFDVMNYKGRATGVSAIALDPESQAGFMADDVNRHIISRYLSLAVAAGLPGWAESVRDTETRREENGDQTVISNSVSGTEQLAVITGAIAEAITPAMQQNFNRPPTVKLVNGRPLLIMFMDDVVVD